MKIYIKKIPVIPQSVSGSHVATLLMTPEETRAVEHVMGQFDHSLHDTLFDQKYTNLIKKWRK